MQLIIRACVSSTTLAGFAVKSFIKTSSYKADICNSTEATPNVCHIVVQQRQM